MTGVVFQSGASGDDYDDVSTEFKSKYGDNEGIRESRPGLEKAFSYKAVGRLSRWDGGTMNPYQESKLGQHTIKDDDDDDIPEKIPAKQITIGEFIKQFLRPNYDFTEVSYEDIERVKIMHDRFLGDAQFNFNYSTLLVIASVIAGVGLGMNSAASVIASMLVSPLMGPVTAIAYGVAIGDYKMVRMAIVTEVSSIAICVLVGVILTLLFLGPVQNGYIDEWPTSEMTSRGTPENFIAGIPIAFFSGLGVAVGLLDSQTNSLVGVAISASLLPPAVNGGMLYVFSIFDKDDRYGKEGTWSICLTIMNILVIIIAAMFMFRLKETLPIEKSIFWEDLGVARKIYHNVAIIPKLQEAPDDEEIKHRVTRFFPRATMMPQTSASWGTGTKNLRVNSIDSNDDDEDDTNDNTAPMLNSIKRDFAIQRISE